ncbi:DUF4185 domain-containing protein [Chitinophaga sp. RAB17]|uniref:DUF4185 domain-containing protein n=1 Tax=Chitinophaga sp. RAB17 TaxID=3233049 RepID=UPI003F92AC5E
MKTLLLLLCGFTTHRDSLPELTQLDYKVVSATEWNNLFTRHSGWFGGDGIFTIPMNGVDTAHANDSTLILFSDTMTGDIKAGKLQPGFSMIHNSVAILNGNAPLEKNIRFYWNLDSKGRPATLFEPHTPAAGKDDYYWLGDGFVNAAVKHNTYIFAYRIRNISREDFGFAEVGNVLIVLPAGSKPPFKAYRQIDTPLFLPADSSHGSGSFGGAVFVNTKEAGAPYPDGYVYVYGVRGQEKAVLVARVPVAEVENFGRWRYWDGHQWNADIRQAAAVTEHASNELSLTPLKDGRYALVFQVDGMGTAVGLRLGLTPAGPFGPIILLKYGNARK